MLKVCPVYALGQDPFSWDFLEPCSVCLLLRKIYLFLLSYQSSSCQIFLDSCKYFNFFLSLKSAYQAAVLEVWAQVCRWA